MDVTEFNRFIEVTDECITCTSPTPERESYFRISFKKETIADTRANHIKVAKTLVRRGLISAIFGAIQVHVLENILADTQTI